MTLDVVFKILNSGQVKSCFEKDVKGTYEKNPFYKNSRIHVEYLFGIRSKGTKKDPHPIYGAMGTKEETQTGAAFDYGNCYVKLKEEVIKERTAFSYGDSMDIAADNYGDIEGVNKNRYHYQDLDMVKTFDYFFCKGTHPYYARYIEFQVLGGVELNDIESINIPKNLEENEELNKIIEKNPTIKFNFI